MSFGPSKIVFKMGAKLPLDDGPAVVDRIISGAHKYYNKLIEFGRRQLLEKEELRREFLPGLAEAADRIEEARQAHEALADDIRRRNQEARRRQATPEDLALRASSANRLAEARRTRKEILARVKDDLRYLQIQEQRHLRDNRTLAALYNEADCNWGTRLQTGRAFESAMKIMNPATNKMMERGVDNPPKFKRWTGDGLVTVQTQNGLSLEDLLAGKNGQFRLEKLPPKNGNLHRALAWLRVGSDGDGEAIWLKVPVQWREDFDRLPPGSMIKQASLVRRRGPHRRFASPDNVLGVWRPYDRFELQMTIETSGIRDTSKLATAGLCGVDLGWRLKEDGSLRVAYWVGDDGQEGEVLVPADRWLICNELEIICKDNFNQHVAILSRWLGAQASLPETLTEKTSTLLSWKSIGRLCRLVDTWQPVPGDEDLIKVLRAWRVQEAHLLDYERGRARMMANWRKDHYRQLAAFLAKQYRTISVEDCDWRKLNKLPPVESNDPVNLTARRNIRIAAVGQLRDCLRQCGANTILSETENTTKECHVCHSIEEFDHRKLFHTCSQCGNTWDQDRNAALNLIARAEKALREMAEIETETVPVEGVGAASSVLGSRGSQDQASEEVVAVPPKKGGRWQRRKAKSSRRAAAT